MTEPQATTTHSHPRRPSGDPEALRLEIKRSTYAWAAVLAGVTFATVWALYYPDPPWFEFDETVIGWIESIRTAWVADIADAIEWIGSPWSLRFGLWGGVAILGVYRRWLHLFTLVTVVVFVGWLTEQVSTGIERPRPSDALELIDGFSHPSIGIAGVAVLLAGLGYSLIPRGPHRQLWFRSSTILIVIAAASRLYLGVSHFSDVLIGAFGGAALAVAAFTLFVPDESFPVDYRRRRSAHLPVSGARGLLLREALEKQLLASGGPQAMAMRDALRDQLGCDLVHCQMVDLKPFGQAGSAGSTPLRISVQGRIRGDVFAKLYSTNHLRSDRWYKLSRAILYGRLEDERSFNSVRRLVEYEDYMLRVMRDAGLPSAKPLGVVQIVPGREYMIVTEFFEGSVEIDQADVGQEIIDEGLGVVRGLWDAGLAHRDLKPANLLVQDGRVKLIDVAFGEIRPSPWRKSVDLANMMLILALHVGPDLVYERALNMFSDEDISEAFAASRGLTMPSQLRAYLKAYNKDEGIDLIEAFRRLAPDHPPISVQRWGVRRIGLAVGVLVGAAALVVVAFENLRGVNLL